MTYCLVCRQYTPPKGGDGKTCFYCGNPKCRHDHVKKEESSVTVRARRRCSGNPPLF